MAKIIQTTAQRDALKCVTADLRQLKLLNDFIGKLADGDGNAVVLTASTNGLSVKLTLDIKTAQELLLKQKTKLQKEISANVTKFSITLDDSEKAILER